MNVDLADLNAFRRGRPRRRLSRRRPRQRRQRVRPQRSGAPAGSAARRPAAQPHDPQRRAHRCRRASLLDRLGPALSEVEAALDVVNTFRDRPAGTLRLNVPVSAARLVLPRIVPAFLAAYPGHPAGGDRRGELRRRGRRRLRRRHPLRRAAGAGHDRRADRPARPALRHGRRAAPISTATAGPSTRATCSTMPACAGRFPSGAMTAWEFERDGEIGARSIRRARCSSGSAARPIFSSMRRSPAPASSPCSRTGCARISIAARSSRCSSRGGKASPDRSSTIRAAASCRRRCGPSSTSSRHSAEAA